jgi:hypothetical protein
VEAEAEEAVVEEAVVEEPAVSEPSVEEPAAPVARFPWQEEAPVEVEAEEAVVEEAVVEEPAVAETPAAKPLAPREWVWTQPDDPTVRQMLEGAGRRAGATGAVEWVNEAGGRLCTVGVAPDRPQEVFAASAAVLGAAQALMAASHLGDVGDVHIATENAYICLGVAGGDHPHALVCTVAEGVSHVGRVALAAGAAVRGLEATGPAGTAAEPLQWPVPEPAALAEWPGDDELAGRAAETAGVGLAAASFQAEQGQRVVVVGSRPEHLAPLAGAVSGLVAAAGDLAEALGPAGVQRVLVASPRSSAGCALLATQSTIVGLLPRPGTPTGIVSRRLGQVSAVVSSMT